MKDLIEKLEAASEGSRELDVLIGAAIDFTYEYCPLSVGKAVEAYGAEWMLRQAESQQSVWFNALPRYSTSLDAALSLVPEGMVWQVNNAQNPGPLTQARAEVDYANSSWAASPPLALCIAALRARCSHD